MFFCGLLHFSCDGKSYDECACVCQFFSSSQSKRILCDLGGGFFTLLFANIEAGSGTVLSVSQSHVHFQ